MTGTFVKGCDTLIRQAKGTWSARCKVDQVYAHYQEAHPEFNHPDGGQAFYLRDSLYEGMWMAKMAVGMIDEYGVNVEGKMRETAEGMAAGVYTRAPVEFRDLRRSGHPYVLRDFAQVYNREPVVPRLSDKDLRLKSHLRYLFDPRRYRRS